MYNLHSVIFQKTLTFISAAVIVPNQAHIEEECGNVTNVSTRCPVQWCRVHIPIYIRVYIPCTLVVLFCFVMCGCSGNICTCIYCVFCSLYCIFVLFRLCIYILICFVCTSVRTTATEWQLNCS
jgi:hypothetical protein